MSNAAVLSASIVKSSCERDGIGPTTPIRERALACFKEARTERSGWMLGTDDETFRAGCGALLLLSEGEERDRVSAELRMLQGLSALQRGLPIDMAALIPDGFEALGLLALFQESK